MAAALLHAGDGVLHSAPDLRQATSTIYRVPDRHLINARHPTGQPSPLRGSVDFPYKAGVGIALQGQRPPACKHASKPLLVHRHQLPVDPLIESYIEAVLRHLPLGQPDIDLTGVLRGDDVLRISFLFCCSQRLVGTEVVGVLAGRTGGSAFLPSTHSWHSWCSPVLHTTRLGPWPCWVAGQVRIRVPRSAPGIATHCLDTFTGMTPGRCPHADRLMTGCRRR